MTRTPFCHVFSHRGRDLVYDVATSRLLAVAPVVAAVLPHVDRARTDDLVARLAPRWEEADVRGAMREILAAREQDGLFAATRPHAAGPGWTPEDAAALDRDRRMLTLAITEDCDLRCRYCPHTTGAGGARPHRARTMPLTLALAAMTDFLDHARGRQSPDIAFYGGEPLRAWSTVVRVVEAVRRRNDGDRVRLVLDTNGQGLARPEVRDLSIRERLALQVSLDGPAPVHDRYRRRRTGGPTHGAVESALTDLLRADPSVADRLSLAVTLTPPLDIERLDAYFQEPPFFRAAGIARRPVLRANLVSLEGDELGPGATRADLRAHWRREWKAARQRYLAARERGEHGTLGPVTAALFDGELMGWHHRGAAPVGGAAGRGGCCRPGVRRTHVRTDGMLQPCERVDDGMLLGTAASGLDVVKIEALRRRFAAAVAHRCQDCWAIRFCDLCYTALAAERSEIPEGVCRAVRERTEQRLRLVADLKAAGPQAWQWLENTTVD